MTTSRPLWPLFLLVLACGSEPGAEAPASASPSAEAEAEVPPEIESPKAEASPADAADAEPGEVESPPEVEAEAPVEPTEPPTPPNATPPTLHVALHGGCDWPTVSSVDGHAFVHWTDYGGAEVRRMDAEGNVAEKISFGETIIDLEDDNELESEPTTVVAMRGRYPEQLFMLLEAGGRDWDGYHMYQRLGDQWQRITTLGISADYLQAWPWYDESILVQAIDNDASDDLTSRLIVVKGRPKGPRLDRLARSKDCPYYGIEDITVLGNQQVVALIDCGDEAWMQTWMPGDRNGKATPLGEDAREYQLALNDEGDGVLRLDGALLRWQGGKVEPLAGPPGRGATEVHLDPQGRPWISTGRKVYRLDEEGWVDTGLAKGKIIEQLAGVEHGTPWVRKKREHSVHMQTTDGQWHELPLPRDPQGMTEKNDPRAEALWVVGPGDAWIRARKSRYSWTVITTRPATPAGCHT